MNFFFQHHIHQQWFADWVLLPAWRLLDWLMPKKKQQWAFFVHPLKTDQFVENSRAVFEAVKTDPKIDKVIFTRGPYVNFQIEDACRTRIIDLQSLQGLWMLSRCGVYLLTNAIALDISWRWKNGTFSVVKASLTRRLIVNLWHGIPLKRLFALANPEQRNRADRVAYRRKERAYYRGLIASSDVDSYAMAATFYPIHYSRLWITGLPRSDFLKMKHAVLPTFLREEVELIRSLKGGKRLLTYAPTFRENNFDGAGCYQFTEKEISTLKQLLRKHNAVLGFRMHYFRKGSQLFNMEDYVDGETIIDLGHRHIREIAPVLRESDLIITDYSSVYIDSLYIDKPVISFAYDLDHYRDRQNGLLYEMDLAFPGPVVKKFDCLLVELENELSQAQQVSGERYQLIKKIFFKFHDDCNSARVVNKIKTIANSSER